VVLQALNRAQAIDEQDPEYHLQLTKFSDLGMSSVCGLVLYLKAMRVVLSHVRFADVSEIEDVVRRHNQRSRGTATERLG
jgi:hypothetical protein